MSFAVAVPNEKTAARKYGIRTAGLRPNISEIGALTDDQSQPQFLTMPAPEWGTLVRYPKINIFQIRQKPTSGRDERDCTELATLGRRSNGLCQILALPAFYGSPVKFSVCH